MTCFELRDSLLVLDSGSCDADALSFDLVKMDRGDRAALKENYELELTSASHTLRK